MAIYPHTEDTKDFRDVFAGDETHRYGDYIPFEGDWADGLGIGDMVAVDADGQLVEYTDGSTQDLLGVLYTFKPEATVAGGPDRDNNPDPETDHVTVKTQGTVVANNSAGYADADVGTRGASNEYVLALDDAAEFVHVLLP